MYKVLLLSDVNSSHTQKWAFSLAKQGVEIGVFSLTQLKTESYRGKRNITVFSGQTAKKKVSNKTILHKASYLTALPALKRAIKEFKPAIVHAHYASSYGLLAALSGFHPLLISVWGSDVYDFPTQNALFRALLRYVFRQADKILSTSNVMAHEVKKYTAKSVEVTPFGIDINVFKPAGQQNIIEGLKDSDIVIGTIKTLEKKYGIEYLVKAFALAKNRHLGLPLKLLIVGEGSLLNELRLLVKKLEIEKDTTFTGFVDYKNIPMYHSLFDIEVFPSIMNSESFGVSVVEASACAKPVIVSNVGGLPEVVEDGVTGIVVPPFDVEKLSKAIKKLIEDKDLRVFMGNNGRARVEKLYNLEDNVKQMMEVYESLLKKQSMPQP